MIGIMAAMHEELNRIVAMMVDVSEEKVGRKVVYLGKLNNQKLAVVFSGWGKVAAATTSTMLIERYSISQLIFTGVAAVFKRTLILVILSLGNHFYSMIWIVRVFWVSNVLKFRYFH